MDIDHSITELLIANGAILLGSTVQTTTGTGFAMVSVPLLALINLDLAATSRLERTAIHDKPASNEASIAEIGKGSKARRMSTAGAPNAFPATI